MPSLESRECVGKSQTPSTPSDQYLIRRAVTERWPIPPSLREKIITQLEETIDSPILDLSLKLTAARTAVSIDALNLKEKELKIRSQPKHIIHTNMSTEELLGRVRELQEELGIANPEAAQKMLPGSKDIFEENNE